MKYFLIKLVSLGLSFFNSTQSFSYLSCLFWSRESTTNTAQPISLTISRKAQGANCIIGDLKINDRTICHTLELPYIDNIDTISTLPSGTYAAKIRADSDRGWRIELENVPSRSNVQIHVGNFTSQIFGCTLVGTSADLNTCVIFHSKDAMKLLETEFLSISKNLCIGCSSSSAAEILVTYVNAR